MICEETRPDGHMLIEETLIILKLRKKGSQNDALCRTNNSLGLAACGSPLRVGD